MKRLSGNQIRVGQPIPFDCYDSQGNLLLKKGLIVDSQRQVDALVERGLFGVDTASGSGENPNIDDKPPSPFQLLNDYANRLKQLFALITSSSIDERENAAKSFPDRIGSLAVDVQKVCQLNTDAVLGAIHLDNTGRYSVSHALYRAVICDLLALRKKLSDEDRRKLIVAALTCDLSIMKLQDEVIRQNEPLTPQHKISITNHPMESAKMLSTFNVTDPQIIKAVVQHHERLNGSGYPAGAVSTNISEWAKILRLADIYTAMIAPKTYRKAFLSKTAMREILLKRGTEIDEMLSVFIVKELGVYPPGSFVKLQNGELAIVINRSANPKAPNVKSVVGPRGAPFDKPILRNTTAREFEILDVVERDPIVVINLHLLWGY